MVADLDVGSEPSAWTVNVTTTSWPAAYVEVSCEPPGPARYASTAWLSRGPSRIRTWAIGTGGASEPGSVEGKVIASIRPR